MPPVLDVHRPPEAASAAREDALRVAFDVIDRELGGVGLARFSDLFDVPVWVCNLPELDPYAPLRKVAARGPLEVHHASEALLRGRIPPLLGSQVFVYAKPSPLLPRLMESLAPRCRTIELYVPGATEGLHNPWPHVTVHLEPRRSRCASARVQRGGAFRRTQSRGRGAVYRRAAAHSVSAPGAERHGCSRAATWCRLWLPQHSPGTRARPTAARAGRGRGRHKIGQTLEKILPVPRISEDISTLDPLDHDMVDNIGNINAS